MQHIFVMLFIKSICVHLPETSHVANKPHVVTHSCSQGVKLECFTAGKGTGGDH